MTSTQRHDHSPAALGRADQAAPSFRYTPAPDRLSPFVTTPAYREAGTGRPAAPPATGGTYSLAALATWFTWPALSTDLFPAPPWSGLERVRHAPPRPRGHAHPRELRDRLEAAVERAIGDREHVAVATSGGLDSAALLAVTARVCRRTGRRLLAVTMDIPDDRGRRPKTVVDRLLEFLGLRCPHLRVDPAPRRWPEPEWCEHGPRFDGFPRLHRGMAELAVGAGAQVLLHGSGADQLLEAPGYMAARVLRTGSPGDLMAYLRDASAGGGPPLRELVAVLAGRLGRRASSDLYWATAWPRRLQERGSPLLTGEMHERACAWEDDHRRESARVAAEAGASWAEALMIHRTFPYDVVVPATGLPEAAPYYDPVFAEYAFHLPQAVRYSGAYENEYLRRKRLVADLLPDGIGAVLPPYRQRGSQSYARYWRLARVEPTLAVERGLLRPDWRTRCRDTFEVATASAVELWLRGAEARGASA
ncbi:asparagine synthase-related protein [Nonomuraea roseoviolacea]|uniref:Asparagine synthetase B (Glutamine-hydrolyzing) n=1 Tax=Nonomuraea roseoviolacea subsp. carminata TaxID=160689 RepID=A0ABT1KBD0_9ACTN|nr:asparagine synthase-related protein [Nonomuraea roseoviolacea]MCP2351265.1 asparagine synthetase B (glutamine-hydrolyzing) [Nonomuraea roseoviolacea subsp. carminata]